MRIILFLILGLLMTGCSEKNRTRFRNDFTREEEKLLRLSRDIISRAYFATFVTMHENQPHPRVMEPFPPAEEWIIWLGTNAKSRKVAEIKRNPVATLHYFDRSIPAYVNLYGRAYPVDDRKLKDSIWREAWEEFYPGRSNYLLIKFVPDSLEMINPAENLPGDKETWKPYSVRLRK